MGEKGPILIGRGGGEDFMLRSPFLSSLLLLGASGPVLAINDARFDGSRPVVLNAEGDEEEEAPPETAPETTPGGGAPDGKTQVPPVRGAPIGSVPNPDTRQANAGPSAEGGGNRGK